MPTKEEAHSQIAALVERFSVNSIVHLIETMLQLQKEKQQTNLPDKLNQLEARINYTE
jgi:uncharacterized protein YpiB (UPF0302 family)